MSLVFAALCPHPPLLIPEVGGSELDRVEKTKKAMEGLGKRIAQAAPSTIIVISPHGLIYPDRMNVCGVEKLYGDFGHFGAQEIGFHFDNNLSVAEAIDKLANQNNVPTLLYDHDQQFYELDHGILVPLYYLTQQLGGGAKVLPVAYSMLPPALHYSFGQIIQDVIQAPDQKIAVIASGDMSHRLKNSQYGYSKVGEKFDKEIQELILNKKVDEILTMEEGDLEQAGECGYRSLLILLGVLNNIQYQPQILSYEGPFGVGYLTVDFQLGG